MYSEVKVSFTPNFHYVWEQSFIIIDTLTLFPGSFLVTKESYGNLHFILCFSYNLKMVFMGQMQTCILTYSFQAPAAYYVFALCNQRAVHCMNDSLEGGITSFMTDQKRAEREVWVAWGFLYWCKTSVLVCSNKTFINSCIQT